MAKLTTECSIKSTGEALAFAQAHLPNTGQGRTYREVLQRLIDECNWQRPVGSNGKHGNLHTRRCGCDGVKWRPWKWRRRP